ncbi:class I SAM-dependent methyltransferase [Microseira wollei]|uniref:Methyltransferase type 12 n=1 Tax=Microseira wollei NIES-4236 TaxID=2530354 RepID=A0AAV3WM13_9CYAN|nr:class I SAM-dependent methyltransferase [Microseira wollei]GET42294.1 methyltransferase type 12 [Microseira wollei NIES-4236]
MELGCGNGVLGRAVLAKYPDASGGFLDVSQAMLEAAQSQVENHQKLEFISQDFVGKDWVISVENKGGFDVITQVASYKF